MPVSKDMDEISVVLNSYQDALNASSTDQAVKLYAPDGVLMAQHSPSAVGTDEVRKAYEEAFASSTLHVKFTIVEIVPTAPNWAFARTSSAGTVTVKAGGGGLEANQELFILQKLGGGWKIARYCFSTTNRPC